MKVSTPHEYWTPRNGQTGNVAVTFTTEKRTTPNGSGETYPLEFRVLVDGVAEEHRADLDAFIAGLVRYAEARSMVEAAEAAAERAGERAARLDIARRAAEARVDAMLGQTPAGRLMGDGCHVRPHTGDDWAGPVWLLDPVKGFAGFGFQFPSLADLWRAHPYLRPAATGHDSAGPWMRVVVHRHLPGETS